MSDAEREALDDLSQELSNLQRMMGDRLAEDLKQLCNGSCQVGYSNDPYPDCIFCRARARVEELEQFKASVDARIETVVNAKMPNATNAALDRAADLHVPQPSDVEMDRDAYRKYAKHLYHLLRVNAWEAIKFDDFIEAKNIPHPNRQGSI